MKISITGSMSGIVVIALLQLSACASLGKREDAMALANQADAAYERQDWAGAEQHYRRLAQRVPQDAQAYFRLGNVLARQGRFDEAASAYQDALLRDASLSKAYNNLAMVRLLQAEFAFEASLEKAGSSDTFAPHTKKMLNALNKITRIPMQEANSPPVRRMMEGRVQRHEKTSGLGFPVDADPSERQGKP